MEERKSLRVGGKEKMYARKEQRGKQVKRKKIKTTENPEITEKKINS